MMFTKEKVYRKFYKCTSGVLLDKTKELSALNKEQAEQIRLLINELGAKEAKIVFPRIAGFEFAEKPDSSLWKQVRHGYYPKRNSKKGNELRKKIEALRIDNINDALNTVGLHEIWVCDGRAFYNPYLLFLEKDDVVLVSVPWIDVSDAELDNYIQSRQNGFRDATLDSLLWKPPVELEPIKESTFLRIQENYSDGYTSKQDKEQTDE